MVGWMLGSALLMPAIMHYMKQPNHVRCPAGRRKNRRKLQAQARRILRNPKYRGDRAQHRAARRLLALTRKCKPGMSRYRGKITGVQTHPEVKTQEYMRQRFKERMREEVKTPGAKSCVCFNSDGDAGMSCKNCGYVIR